MKVDVVCVSWNARMDNGSVVVDVGFNPANQVAATHGMGAVIGSPNTPNPELQKTEKPLYNVLSGSLLVNISDAEEAKKYEVGKTYSLSVGVAQATEDKPKAPAK